jgi:glycosyltransferase involved in cell wall biosynthesis
MRHMTSRRSSHAVVEGAARAMVLRAMAPLDRAIWRDLGARAFAIDTPTAPYADQITEWLGVDREKIFVKDNTVNTARFQPGRRAEARSRLGLERFGRIVGYAGGHAHQRGGEQMFQTAANILARFPDTGFVIVGGGNGMEALKARIQAAGLEHAFVVPGIVPYDVVPDYISAFDVGVALDIFEREQSLGNAHQKIRQYLATGVPVVMGSDNVLVEQKLAVSVPANDIGAFEAAVLGWLELDDGARADFRDRARRYAVENLSTAASLVRQIEFWEERRRRLPG